MDVFRKCVDTLKEEKEKKNVEQGSISDLAELLRRKRDAQKNK